MPKPIHIIVACSENRVIGRAGHLPWSIPEDTAFFQGQTRGHTVIMGRHSFEEWPSAGKERDVVVVTHEPLEGVACAPTLAEAIARAQRLRGDVYLCGGQRVYEEGLPLAGRLYLTLVHAELPGDRFFPDWRAEFPREVSRRESQDANWRYAFLVLER
ncbi:MAG TPA: dihydrofolate reductase [Opitutaceae bacterium]